jgi:hypothetical protein
VPTALLYARFKNDGRIRYVLFIADTAKKKLVVWYDL